MTLSFFKMRIKTGLSLLLILCAANASAQDTAAFAAEPPAGGRVFSLQHATIERAGPRSTAAMLDPAFPPDRRLPGQTFSDVPGAAAPGLPETSAAALESARRTRSLNAEERKTLRRQINEVGHDIYTPGR